MLDDWIQFGIIYTQLVCPIVFGTPQLQNTKTIIGSEDQARTIMLSYWATISAMPVIPVDFRVTP
jgi:hypothetical protein